MHLKFLRIFLGFAAVAWGVSAFGVFASWPAASAALGLGAQPIAYDRMLDYWLRMASGAKTARHECGRRRSGLKKSPSRDRGHLVPSKVQISGDCLGYCCGGNRLKSMLGSHGASLRRFLPHKSRTTIISLPRRLFTTQWNCFFWSSQS